MLAMNPGLLALTALLIAAPHSASAGRQPNPLPLYAADGAEYALAFGRGGLTLHNMQHVPVGARKYRYERSVKYRYEHSVDVAKQECTEVVSELRLKRSGEVEWRMETRDVCRGVVLEVALRTLYREPPTRKCRRQTLTFVRKGQTLTLADECDGTAIVRLSGVAGQVRVSRQGGRRWKGKGYAHHPGPTTWNIKRLTWRLGRNRLKLRGTIRHGAVEGSRPTTQKLRGTWKLQHD
jgi:hypothetical protein